MALTLNDFLQLNGEDFDRAGIKINMTNLDGANPLKDYFVNPHTVNNGWLFYKNGVDKFDGVGSLAICLVRCEFTFNDGTYKGDRDTWLLTTIKRITKDLPVIKTTGYDGYELADFHQNYFGRLIIEYHNSERLLIKNYSNVQDTFKIKQLLPREARSISNASSVVDKISDFLDYITP